MNEQWLSGNSYLRLLSSLHQEPDKVMNIFTQSPQELQLVSEAIQKFVKHMSITKVRQGVKCHIRISLLGNVSKEMST